MQAVPKLYGFTICTKLDVLLCMWAPFIGVAFVQFFCSPEIYLSANNNTIAGHQKLNYCTSFVCERRLEPPTHFHPTFRHTERQTLIWVVFYNFMAIIFLIKLLLSGNFKFPCKFAMSIPEARDNRTVLLGWWLLLIVYECRIDEELYSRHDSSLVTLYLLVPFRPTSSVIRF